MFLTSYNVYVVFGYAGFMCIFLITATWPFLAFLGQGLAFFSKNRLATPSQMMVVVFSLLWFERKTLNCK